MQVKPLYTGRSFGLTKDDLGYFYVANFKRKYPMKKVDLWELPDYNQPEDMTESEMRMVLGQYFSEDPQLDEKVKELMNNE